MEGLAASYPGRGRRHRRHNLDPCLAAVPSAGPAAPGGTAHSQPRGHQGRLQLDRFPGQPREQPQQQQQQQQPRLATQSGKKQKHPVLHQPHISKEVKGPAWTPRQGGIRTRQDLYHKRHLQSPSER
ncbi:uncharacterized protein LOC129545172 isoform X3 [Moschus berezovskii]|uniref:uncharacterized protein LOC129545172 isoform X3 n=1 Tax=Moschus berezovskii TaxID=68408 RepID=UPI002443CD74|nr:uncharacterized protein LOC129545172 isoform X3 [Moschus berezovskii]